MKVTPARAFWLSLLGVGVLRGLGATWRVRRQGVAPADWHIIGAFLHGDLLMMAHVFKGFGAAVMISQHGDGELIARVTQRTGNQAVRGSSTRGGARAFHEMVRQWGDRPWGITPDGPRGPRGSVHEGVIQMAADAQRPIYPVGFACSRGKRLASWDRFTIPASFARIVVHLGEPMRLPSSVERGQRKALARELEARLTAAEVAAAAGLGGPPNVVVWPPRPPRR